jgi:hypothetical protein
VRLTADQISHSLKLLSAGQQLLELLLGWRRRLVGRTDLVIPAAPARLQEVQGLLRALSSRWLAGRMQSVPACDASLLGMTVR